jgi:hypothetical protein
MSKKKQTSIEKIKEGLKDRLKNYSSQIMILTAKQEETRAVLETVEQMEHFENRRS